MLDRLHQRLGIRPSETKMVTRLFWLHFILIASYTLARIARNALFLEEVRARNLPYLYIAVAFFTALISVGMARLSSRQMLQRSLSQALLVCGAALLIFVQPDLGSASVLGAIWVVMVWVAGASTRTLGCLAFGALAVSPLGWHVLKAYQRDRLMAFIDPHADPLGAGYTIIQSTIAIGSGRLWGRGWFAGT
jgi:rod shape determining protein RodA